MKYSAQVITSSLSCSQTGGINGRGMVELSAFSPVIGLRSCVLHRTLVDTGRCVCGCLDTPLLQGDGALFSAIDCLTFEAWTDMVGNASRLLWNYYFYLKG